MMSDDNELPEIVPNDVTEQNNSDATEQDTPEDTPTIEVQAPELPSLIEGNSETQNLANKLSTALAHDAETAALSQMRFAPDVMQIIRRLNSVETSLLMLLEQLDVTIPATQINVAAGEVIATKVKIVAHGKGYGLEQILHAMVLGQQHITALNRRIEAEQVINNSLIKDAERTETKFKMLNLELEKLRKEPPPALFDVKAFVLAYRDRKGRLNYLHRDASGVYYRTRDIGKAMRFSHQNEATRTFLDVLNNPALNAFPNAYRLGFISLHVINHGMTSLDNNLATRLGEALRHAQEYEAENRQPKKACTTKRKTNRRRDKSTSKNRRTDSK